jgi:spore germination cell wall hydrolase CwlJ-like protein
MVELLQVACMAIALIGETHGANNIKLTHGVGYVIMNRANNDTSKLCQVTEAPYQFEGTKHVMTGKRTIDEKTLLTYELISLQIINRQVPNPVGHATHFHDDRVKPYWTYNKKKITRIDNVTFY